MQPSEGILNTLKAIENTPQSSNKFDGKNLFFFNVHKMIHKNRYAPT